MIGGKLHEEIPSTPACRIRYRATWARDTPRNVLRQTEVASAALSQGTEGRRAAPENDIAVLYAVREALGPEFGLESIPMASGREQRRSVARNWRPASRKFNDPPGSGSRRAVGGTKHPLATNMC
jgi:hypothetical protein